MSLFDKIIIFTCDINNYQSVLAGLDARYQGDREQ